MAFQTRNVKEVHHAKEKKQKRLARWNAMKESVKKIGLWIGLQIKSHSKGFMYLGIGFFSFVAFAVYLSSNGSQVAKTALSITSSLIGSDLQQTPNGFTNILLIGSGGEKHEGGYLTDSIIVASIQHQTQEVTMISIPRDLYLSFYVDNTLRKGKINELFRDGMVAYKDSNTAGERFSLASNDLKTKVSEILGVPIHYTLYIDFAGFVKVVDALGGVSVDVLKDINDPLYPGPNFTYSPFRLKAGFQTLSGTVALKYVRSRHGNAGGDFGRSARQKQMIVALKDKALSSGVFTSPTKIQEILNIIKENFWTDLSWKELLSLVNIAGNINKDHIFSYNITNTERSGMGWFLYTPARDLYGGMSVLVPYLQGENNPWAQIQLYYFIVTNFPNLSADIAKVHVYNTTKKEGIASSVAEHLLRYGINSTAENSQENYPVSTVEYVSTPETENVVAMLRKKVSFAFQAVPESPTRRAGEYYILLGQDYSSKMLLWNPSLKDIPEPVYTNVIEIPKSTPDSITENLLESPLPLFSPSEVENTTPLPTRKIPSITSSSEVTINN